MGAIRSERSGKGCTRHVAGKARGGWQGSGPNYSSGGPVQPQLSLYACYFQASPASPSHSGEGELGLLPPAVAFSHEPCLIHSSAVISPFPSPPFPLLDPVPHSLPALPQSV